MPLLVYATKHYTVCEYCVRNDRNLADRGVERASEGGREGGREGGSEGGRE